MLASRRGGRVRILRHTSAVETVKSFIHPHTVRRRHRRTSRSSPKAVVICERHAHASPLHHTILERYVRRRSTPQLANQKYDSRGYVQNSPLAIPRTVGWRWAGSFHFQASRTILQLIPSQRLVPRIDSILHTHSKQHEWSCFLIDCIGLGAILLL